MGECNFCLENEASNGCICGGVEFKTELRGESSSDCQVSLVCICFVNVMFTREGSSMSRDY